MPPKGYRHLSLREEVYNRLVEFAKSRGLAGASEAVTILLEYADIHSKLEQLVREQCNSQPKPQTPQALQTRRKRLVECVRNVKDPGAYVNKIAETTGRNIVWIEREKGVVCYADEDEARKIVEELNKQGVTPDKLPQDHPAKELREHGFIYYDSTRKVWEVA